MWIREPQRVNEEIEYLGTTDMCVYLLKGREYMFIEGGMSYVVPTVLKQLEERGSINRRSPSSSFSIPISIIAQ